MRSISGLSASILDLEKALPTSDLSLVCLGGSESRMLSACNQLNSAHSLSGDLGVKILPKDLVLSTALASLCLAANHIPKPSCQTGLPSWRSSFSFGYGSRTKAGS